MWGEGGLAAATSPHVPHYFSADFSKDDFSFVSYLLHDRNQL
jgi:hypothetical protein